MAISDNALRPQAISHNIHDSMIVCHKVQYNGMEYAG